MLSKPISFIVVSRVFRRASAVFRSVLNPCGNSGSRTGRQAERGDKKDRGSASVFQRFYSNNITVKRGFINRETPFFSECFQKSPGRCRETVSRRRSLPEKRLFQAVFPFFSENPLEKKNAACYIKLNHLIMTARNSVVYPAIRS